MRFRPEFTNNLTELEVRQLADHPRPAEQRHHQSGQHAEDGAEGEIAKQVQATERVFEPHGQVIEHDQ